MKKLQKLLTNYELKKAIELDFDDEIGEEFEYRIEIGKNYVSLYEFRGDTEDREFSDINELEQHIK